MRNEYDMRVDHKNSVNVLPVFDHICDRLDLA